MKADDDDEQLVPSKPSILTTLKALWNPRPILTPQIDPDLLHLNGLQRAVEALSYALLSLEHWDPSGKMREFIRIHAILARLLLIPVLLILSNHHTHSRSGSGMIAAPAHIACSLVMIPLAILATIIRVKVIIIVTKALFRK